MQFLHQLYLHRVFIATQMSAITTYSYHLKHTIKRRSLEIDSKIVRNLYFSSDFPKYISMVFATYTDTRMLFFFGGGGDIEFLSFDLANKQ